GTGRGRDGETAGLRLGHRQTQMGGGAGLSKSEEHAGHARWDRLYLCVQHGHLVSMAGGRRSQWHRQDHAPIHQGQPEGQGSRHLVVKGGAFASYFGNEKGERITSQKRIDVTGSIYAQPVYGDGKIYVVGHSGQIAVLADGPEMTSLATNDMGEACVATPAIA